MTVKHMDLFVNSNMFFFFNMKGIENEKLTCHLKSDMLIKCSPSIFSTLLTADMCIFSRNDISEQKKATIKVIFA